MIGARDRAGAFARALIDRLAFAGESAAVAVLIMALVGFAATRFDFAASAHVWGLFWLRIAEADAAVRAPVMALLGLVLGAVTTAVAFVRWPKASRAFDAFPPSRRDLVRLQERLG